MYECMNVRIKQERMEYGALARRRGSSGLKTEFGIWLVLERKAGPQPHQANSSPFWTSEAGAAPQRGCLSGTVLSKGTHPQTDVRRTWAAKGHCSDAARTAPSLFGTLTLVLGGAVAPALAIHGHSRAALAVA